MKSPNTGLLTPENQRIRNMLRQLDTRDAQIAYTTTTRPLQEQVDAYKEAIHKINKKAKEELGEGATAEISLYDESGLKEGAATKEDVETAQKGLKKLEALTPNYTYLSQLAYGSLNGTWDQWRADGDSGKQPQKNMRKRTLRTRANMSSVDTFTDLERQINRARREKLGEHLATISHVQVTGSDNEKRRPYFANKYREQYGAEEANIAQAVDTLALRRVGEMYLKKLGAMEKLAKENRKASALAGNTNYQHMYGKPGSPYGRKQAIRRYCTASRDQPNVNVNVPGDVDGILYNRFKRDGKTDADIDIAFGIVNDGDVPSTNAACNILKAPLVGVDIEKIDNYDLKTPKTPFPRNVFIPVLETVLPDDWIGGIEWPNIEDISVSILYWAVPIAKALSGGDDKNAMKRVPFLFLGKSTINAIVALYEDENTIDPLGIFLRLVDDPDVSYEALTAQADGISDAKIKLLEPNVEPPYWVIPSCDTVDYDCKIQRATVWYNTLAAIYHIISTLKERVAWLITVGCAAYPEDLTHMFSESTVNPENIECKKLLKKLSNFSTMLNNVVLSFRSIFKEMVRSGDSTMAMQDILFSNTIATATVNNALLEDDRELILKKSKVFFDTLRRPEYNVSMSDWLGLRSIYAVGSVPFNSIGMVPPFPQVPQ